MYFTLYFFYICSIDLRGKRMKASTVSTITKSLPIEYPSLVNYYLLATLDYVNLFIKKKALIEQNLLLYRKRV